MASINWFVDNVKVDNNHSSIVNSPYLISAIKQLEANWNIINQENGIISIYVDSSKPVAALSILGFCDSTDKVINGCFMTV